MADDLNSLLQANRSASVLQGIANPPQINPLAAMNSAVSAATGVYNLRGAQAKEAAGQAYQGAINPQTGELDANEFRRRLAASGPAALAAGEELTRVQAISTDELNQHKLKIDWQNNSAGTLARLGPNITEAHVMGILQDGLRGRMLTQPDYDREVAKVKALGGDPASLYQYATQHQWNAMSAQQRLDRQYGTRQAISTPQGTYVTTVPPPGADQQDIVVPHGPAPGSTTKTFVPMDDQGIIPVDGSGKPQRPPVRWQQIEVPVAAVPGVPQGGPPQRVPPAGGGGASVIPPNPNVPSGTAPGRNSPLRNPAAGTGTAAPAAPGATTPAPVAVAAPSTPPVVASPPQGQQATIDADVAAYNTDKATLPTVITRSENMGHAYDALRLMKMNTGKGAQEISGIRSFLGTVGLLPSGAVEDNKLKEIFAKYTERAIIDAAGGGSTDLGKRLQEQANAGVSLSTPANLEILRSDLGKTLQTVAAHKAHDPALGGAQYLESRAKLADSTDARGFVWNMYDSDEQRRILAEVKGTAAEAKLHKAIGMAARLNMTIPVRPLAAPPPDRRSEIMPPPMAQPPAPGANPLLA